MKIELFLDGNQVEINQDIDFVLNKQYTELTDLTSIIVDYSKTIKVPMTPRNNELFNYIYKLEHQVLMGQDIVNYDPSQKIPMTMTFNGSMVMEGYAVLNSVDTRNKTYEVNIYGQLGKIFSDLKQKSLVNYNPGSNGFWETIVMNTRTIHDTFANDHHSLDWSSTDWTDFWGFAPQVIGKTDTIDTKSYEKHNPTDDADRIKSMVDVINTTRGIDYADTYVKDGLDFNQYCEIRTYMTRPYVYVDKLVQLVQNEINEGDYDGYTMTLDNDWFNSNNPYYNDMVYFPGKESVVDSGDNLNAELTWSNSELTMYFPTSFRPSVVSENLTDAGCYYMTNGDQNYILDSQTSGTPQVTITLNCDNVVVRDRVTGVGSTSGFNENGKWAFYNLDNLYEVPIRYIGIYDGSDQLMYKLYLCDDKIVSVYKHTAFLDYEWSKAEVSNVWAVLKRQGSKVITPNSCTWVNGSSNNNYCELTQQYNFGNIVLNSNVFTFRLGCDIISLQYGTVVQSNISWSDYKTLCPFKNDKYKNEVWNNGATWSSHFRPIQNLSVSSNTYRSGSMWTIKDVLGNDFNPFKWLIDYVKKFRLFFDIDYQAKTINLKGGYFNSVDYKTVTVDYSPGVTIEPVVDKFNRVKWGYGENKCRKGSKYVKNYGVEYGDMDIKTGIDINSDSLSLISNQEENVFIPTDLKALSWSTLNSTQQLKYTNPLITTRIINTLDKDGKIAYFPFYAFRWHNLWNPYQHMVPFYYISDDTPYQRSAGEYTYLDRNGWNTEQEGTAPDGIPYYYLIGAPAIPQFDNYISKTVTLRNNPIVPGRALRSGGVDDDTITAEEVEGTAEELVESEYTDPVTGQVRRVRRIPTRSGDGSDPEEEETQTFLYWVSFGVPAEVYNGYVPGYIESYSIYNRWKNYLDEIFNINNKKVTCYVRMSYPEFINFKFNQLFVIDNCTFLVNKICDFNPNSTAPTKVELIQIDNVNNLK